MRKNMVRLLAVAAAASMAAASVCFAEEAKTFSVGFDAEYPPYGYMDEDGEYTGFDLELAQAVCDLEGWELVKTPIDWDSKDMELDSGAIDCIWSGFTINGREDDYAWSVPYVDNSQVIVVSDASGVTDLAGLEGKIVGVQAASAALELLSEGGDQADLAATFGELQQFPDYNSAEGYSILDETLNSEQYGIGFKIGNEELRDTVDAALDVLVVDGTVAELAEKYDLTDMVCLGEGIEADTAEAESELMTESMTE